MNSERDMIKGQPLEVQISTQDSDMNIHFMGNDMKSVKFICEGVSD